MQKFNKGDLVKVDKELKPGMSHFHKDCDAVVVGSYADKFGGDNNEKYSIYIKGIGECSWYFEDQLTLIEHDRIDLVDKWDQEINLKADPIEEYRKLVETIVNSQLCTGQTFNFLR